MAHTELPIVQAFNNPITIFSNIILYRVFSSNVYEHPKYHQHQY